MKNYRTKFDLYGLIKMDSQLSIDKLLVLRTIYVELLIDKIKTGQLPSELPVIGNVSDKKIERVIQIMWLSNM